MREAIRLMRDAVGRVHIAARLPNRRRRTDEPAFMGTPELDLAARRGRVGRRGGRGCGRNRRSCRNRRPRCNRRRPRPRCNRRPRRCCNRRRPRRCCNRRRPRRRWRYLCCAAASTDDTFTERVDGPTVNDLVRELEAPEMALA